MKKFIKNPLEQKQRGTVAILLCVVFFIASGCRSEDDDIALIIIPFSEFSGMGVGSGMEYGLWKNLNHDDRVIIVNSREEMKKYIARNIGDYPDIDFSKHSLLLASGTTMQGIGRSLFEFSKTSKNRYQLNGEIWLSDALAVTEWQKAFVTNKLSERSRVNLNVRIIRN